MKRFILGLVMSLIGLIGHGAVVEVNIGDQYNPFYLSFDWVDESHSSLKTADAVVDFVVTDRYETRADGCQNHIHEAKVTGSSPHRGGATWVLSNNGIPAEVEVNDVNYPVIGIGDFSFAFGPGDIQYKLPESIKYIGKGAFFNSTPQQIDYNKFTEIGDYAFYGNKVNGDIKLTNVEKLGKYAFANCGFSRVSIDGPLKEIGEGAFYNTSNSGIVSIYIGDDIEVIGDHAFDACTSMGGWGNTTPDGNSALYIGKSVRYIGNYAFHEIRNLSQELIIPDTTTYIGDYAFCHCFQFCPITLGKNVEYIGAYAFYKANHMCSNTMEIPGSVKTIGPMAFDFTRHAEGSRTNGITDLNVHSSTPPDLPTDENGMCAFGDLDPDLHFWDVDGWWFFPWVCLHIPQGSYLDYANHPYWGKFTCIIDDLIPVETEAISNMINYVFIVPGETYKLPTEPNGITYKVLGESDNISLNDNTITGVLVGNDVVLGEYERVNEVVQNGEMVQQIDKITSATIVFVCPTITLVYDVIEPVAQVKTLAMNTSDNLYDDLVDEHATYRHRVVYDSYPKVSVRAATGIVIDTMEKGKFDEDYNQTGEYENGLQEIGEEQQVDGYIVPLNPIVENRVIVLSATINIPDQSLSGILDPETNVRIYAVGTTLYIEGTDEVVEVYDMQGRLVLRTPKKSIDFDEVGVYIVKAGLTTVKIHIY